MLIVNLLLAVLPFVSPVRFDVSLAGNFGEPRPHHFHGGLDIKTQREEGKPVHSIGDGYVCRVSVSTTGYGNAVYVRHPDGHTSIYAHLQRFAPAIEAKVKRWQYEHRSWEADVPFRATDCPVTQGQVIALSGNTGSSMGPHLHLEIHETDSWDMIDPLEVIPQLLNDRKAPEAHGCMAYPQPGKGTFCGKSGKVRFSPVPNDSVQLYAWGDVGFAIHADDYMQGSDNYYGIRHTTLYVDDRVVFSSDVNGIPVRCNRMVNSWGDYDEFREHKHWYMKSFVEEGNTLPILSTDDNKGIVRFDQKRDYHLRYVLSDFFGNTLTCRFTVRGRRTTIPPVRSGAGDMCFAAGEENSVQREDFRLTLPRGCLATDVVIHPVDSASAWSRSYRLAAKSVPLIDAAQVSIRPQRQVPDASKLYVAADGTYLGGDNHDGWVSASVSDIGQTFCLDYDDVPPVIERLTDGRPGVILFDVRDHETAVASVEALVDGHFILLAPVGHSTRYVCRLADTPLRKTGHQRQLRVVASDRRGNKNVYTTTIKY